MQEQDAMLPHVCVSSNTETVSLSVVPPGGQVWHSNLPATCDASPTATSVHFSIHTDRRAIRNASSPLVISMARAHP